MRRFTDHWYAPAHAANCDLFTGRRFDGRASYHTVSDRTGATSGLAAVKPDPLDSRGCLVRLEDEGRVTVCFGVSLTDYMTGTPTEVAEAFRDFHLTANPDWAGYVYFDRAQLERCVAAIAAYLPEAADA